MFSDDYAGGKTALSSVATIMRDDLTDGELAVLARSEELKVRAAVGARPQTPLTSLIVLAADEAPAVRAGVARNPRVDIPLEVRETLAQDRSPEVLHALIRCPAVPASILSRLSRSWNRDVASAAKERQRELKTSGVIASAVGQVGFASR
jgi:N-acetylmuramic acid 6-phosphate (MurNAc-6-P) etherase